MRRALALLAVACGVAVLFATAAQPPRSVIRVRVLTSPAECYQVTWTRYEKVTTEKPCAAGLAETGSVEYVLPPTR